MAQWLTNLRNKSQAEKLRLIWTTVIMSAVLLLVIWIVAAHYSARPQGRDTTFFETISRGFHDVKANFKK